jgi:integrase
MMNEQIDQRARAEKTKARRNERLSGCGKWRTFAKIPNLLQYVSTGAYYARSNASGKSIRKTLKADTFEEAKLALHDFLARLEEPAPVRGTVGMALRAYIRQINSAHDLSAQTKRYRRYCLRALLKSWPGLRKLKIDKVTLPDCQDWANRFSQEKDEQYFNNTLSVLRTLLELAGLGHDQNPARKIKRLGVKPTEMQLPEPDQFNRILEIVDMAGAPQSHDCANFIRFLAFSGCRLSEARQVTWADIDLERGEITVHNAKRSKRSNAWATRQVPIIPPMRELLQNLGPGKPDENVCNVGECEKSLTRACKLVKVARITHHDLRHLFATRCIEAGVDIPTVSRWLGHLDGGALAMRVYGHLRREHSAAMAAKVTFSAPTNVVPMPVITAVTG